MDEAGTGGQCGVSWFSAVFLCARAASSLISTSLFQRHSHIPAVLCLEQSLISFAAFGAEADTVIACPCLSLLQHPRGAAFAAFLN